jgi:hypothetical protein
VKSKQKKNQKKNIKKKILKKNIKKNFVFTSSEIEKILSIRTVLKTPSNSPLFSGPTFMEPVKKFKKLFNKIPGGNNFNISFV